MANPLRMRAVARVGRTLRRPFAALAVGLAASGAFAFALSAEGAGGVGMPRAYPLLVWGEFLAVSTLALVEGGTSIADERRLGTWDAIRLTDLSGGELARGKWLGSLLAALLVVALAAPAHLALAARGALRWEVIAGLHAVLIGTACAVAGLGVMASSRTEEGLHGVALAAASVLFPWFGALDWLASRGRSVWLCRALQPIRHLEGLLATRPPGRPLARAADGVAFLAFAALVSAGTLIVAAHGARRPVGGIATLRGPRRVRRHARPVWDDALRWRETYDPGGRRVVTLVFGAALIPLVALTASSWDSGATGVTRGLSKVVNGYLVTLVVASGVAVGLRASVTLVEERARGTLDLLRLAGIEPSEMIRSKLAAILAPALWTAPALAALAALGYGDLPGRAFAPRAWVGAAGVVAVSLAFTFLVAAISLRISARARSTRVALCLELVLLFALLAGTLGLAISLPSGLPAAISPALAACSPIYQVSLVGAYAARSPSTVGIPMLLGVLGAECVVGLVAVAGAAALPGHRSPDGVGRSARSNGPNGHI